MRFLRFVFHTTRHFVADCWLRLTAWFRTQDSLQDQIIRERERHRLHEEEAAARHRWRQEELLDMVRLRDERLKDMILSNETMRSEFDKYIAINQRRVAESQFDPNSKQRPPAI